MSNIVPQLKKTFLALVQDAGEAAEERVVEFFTAKIRNPNTR